MTIIHSTSRFPFGEPDCNIIVFINRKKEEEKDKDWRALQTGQSRAEWRMA